MVLLSIVFEVDGYLLSLQIKFQLAVSYSFEGGLSFLTSAYQTFSCLWCSIGLLYYIKV